MRFTTSKANWGPCHGQFYFSREIKSYVRQKICLKNAIKLPTTRYARTLCVNFHTFSRLNREKSVFDDSNYFGMIALIQENVLSNFSKSSNYHYPKVRGITIRCCICYLLGNASELLFRKDSTSKSIAFKDIDTKTIRKGLSFISFFSKTTVKRYMI